MLWPTRTIRSKALSPWFGSNVSRACSSASRNRAAEVRDRLAGRVEEHPELIPRGELRGVSKLVDRLHPGPRTGDQAVDEDHGDLAWLVGVEQVEARIHTHPLEVGLEEPGPLQRGEVCPSDLYCQRRRTVGSENDLSLADDVRPIAGTGRAGQSIAGLRLHSPPRRPPRGRQDGSRADCASRGGRTGFAGRATSDLSANRCAIRGTPRPVVR